MALLTQAQRVFARYGVASQELQWAGRPATGLRLRLGDAYSIPFSLGWCAFVVFMERAAIRERNGFFVLWGVPFAMIGIYLLVGRFVWDAYRRSRTWYAVTRDCALILRTGLRPSVQRIYLPAVTSIGLTLKNDGHGTIVFGDSILARFWGGWPGSSSEPSAPSFEGIADAQHVYDLCASAQRGGSAESAQPSET